MYMNDAQKVLTGECRLSYVHLLEPQAPMGGGDPKYSCTLLIPKTDTATKADIDQSINAAFQDGIANKWNGRQPAKMSLPVYDGDGVMSSGEPWGEECKGCWVIRASANVERKPQVVHQSNIRVQLAPNDIYSGMYARVTLRFFAYAASGNNGIGAGLGNVMKTREGERLSGGSTAEQDFAGLEQTASAVPAGTAYPASVPAYPAMPAYSAPAPAPVQINPITGLPMQPVPGGIYGL